MIQNPPASPYEIRKPLLGYEASIRGLASLYYSTAAFFLASMLVFMSVAFKLEDYKARFLILACCMVPLFVFFVILAPGISHLRPWSRTVSLVISAIGLMAVPLGTLILSLVLGSALTTISTGLAFMGGASMAGGASMVLVVAGKAA